LLRTVSVERGDDAGRILSPAEIHPLKAGAEPFIGLRRKDYPEYYTSSTASSPDPRQTTHRSGM